MEAFRETETENKREVQKWNIPTKDKGTEYANLRVLVSRGGMSIDTDCMS